MIKGWGSNPWGSSAWGDNLIPIVVPDHTNPTATSTMWDEASVQRSRSFIDRIWAESGQPRHVETRVGNDLWKEK